MNRFPVLLIFCCWSMVSIGQDMYSMNIDSFLTGGIERPKVLLVGSFHFKYPNLDAHQIDKADQIDVTSPKRQEEIEELVDYIEQFQPTKIVVESGAITGYLLRRRERVNAGTRERQPDEIDQIAFRLMDRLSLDTLYGCDTAGFTWNLEHDEAFQQHQALLNYFFGFEVPADPIQTAYSQFYKLKDRWTVEHSLLEFFRYMNSDRTLDAGFGAYLNGPFKTTNYAGADRLSVWWYNRNLRIYRNIQKINAGPDDRVMVLFGAGHISILKQLFECDPAF
ncbi:MAG: DUF5694 domain-containing protein, partial [Bacteroidota bacterium]